MKSSINLLLLLLSGLAFSVAASAQDSFNEENLDDPEVHAASCRAVDWNRRMLAEYPRLSEACHEVITSGGERWARFETELVEVNRNGSVKSNFRNRQGRNMGAITIQPARDQRVDIDGREYRFEELRPGQVLNVYVPEGAYSFAFAPDAPAEQHVRVVEIQPEPYEAPVRMASSRSLPSTAGPLPLLLIGGALSLLGGLGFTIRRRYTSAGK